jgi:hypothetical protein
MGTGYNPRIITDGLILAFDIANPRCYAGTGNTVFDLSRNNLNGTLVNGPTYSGTGTTSSIVFDRTNDYVAISDNSLLNTFSAMTLEVVVRYTTTNDQLFVQKWNYSGGSQGYTIELYLNEIAAACYNSGTNYLRVFAHNYCHPIKYCCNNTNTNYHRQSNFDNYFYQFALTFFHHYIQVIQSCIFFYLY